MRMRSRCGCPENVMPNMSQTSRSYQFAAGQRSVMLSADRALLSSAVLTRMYSFRSNEKQVVDHREIGSRLPSRFTRTRLSMAVRS